MSTEPTTLLSVRRLAEMFDVDGETVIEWWHGGRIPPPDCRVSRKAIYWKPESIQAFIERGGV